MRPDRGSYHSLAQTIHGHRNIAPADQLLTFLGDELFKDADDEITAR
jgi:hypothetical protein